MSTENQKKIVKINKKLKKEILFDPSPVSLLTGLCS